MVIRYDKLSFNMTTVNINLKDKLVDIGLGEKESAVYLAALELGPSSIWNIHKKAGIKRSTCYLIMEGFVKSGFASKSFDNKRTIFTVVKPRDLLTLFKGREEIFKKSLPLFDALLIKSKEKPNIQMFQGIEGVKQAYALGLSNANNDILIFGRADIWMIDKELNDAYIKERLKRKIHLRVLFSDEKANYVLMDRDQKEDRERKFLPKNKYDPAIEIQILGNMVLFIAPLESEPFAVLIESAALANDERQRFNLLWSLAKKN